MPFRAEVPQWILPEFIQQCIEQSQTSRGRPGGSSRSPPCVTRPVGAWSSFPGTLNSRQALSRLKLLFRRAQANVFKSRKRPTGRVDPCPHQPGE